MRLPNPYLCAATIALVVIALCKDACCQEMIVPDHPTWDDKRICRIDGASGSHISIGGKAYILSCAHLRVDSFMPVGHSGIAQSYRGGSVPAKIIRRSTNYDLTIWEFQQPVSEVHCFALAEQDPQPGEYVTIAGFPMMQNLQPRRVRVSGPAPASCPRPGSLMCDSVDGMGGESGASVVNDRGELCGMFWGGMGEGDGRMRDCFMPASQIKKFLAECETKFGMGKVAVARPNGYCVGGQCYGGQPVMVGPSYPAYTVRPQQQPQYVPPQRPQHPPLVPIQQPTVDVPPPPTPTIDPQALEEMKAEIAEQATADAKAEVSILIDQKLENVQACDCGPKWASLEQRLLEIDARLTALADADESQATVNVKIQNLLTELAASVEAAKPDYEVIAQEMQTRLTHSAQITLLDGTTKPQIKSLNDPLVFIQHSRDVK